MVGASAAAPHGSSNTSQSSIYFKCLLSHPCCGKAKLPAAAEEESTAGSGQPMHIPRVNMGCAQGRLALHPGPHACHRWATASPPLAGKLPSSCGTCTINNQGRGAKPIQNLNLYLPSATEACTHVHLCVWPLVAGPCSWRGWQGGAVDPRYTWTKKQGALPQAQNALHGN